MKRRVAVLYVCIVLLLSICLQAHSEESRLALVIGNSDYSSSPLRNPVNDAQALARTLERLQFKVITVFNGTHRQMKDAIDQFINKLHGYDVGLFYYSGHGVQYQGANYLVPVGADIQQAPDIQFEAVAAEQVLDDMGSVGTKFNIIILDACRNNPFAAKFRSGQRGLSVIQNTPADSLIVYATAPGQEAADGSGPNSPFSAALLRHMSTPGEDVESMLRVVRREVMDATGSRQVPWTSSSLTASFYFAGPTAATAATPTLSATRSYGSLVVTAATEGTLYLDGKAMGDVVLGANAIFDSVEVGQRHVELRYVDGQVEQHTATVEAGNAASVTFTYLKAPPSVRAGSPGQTTDLFALIRTGTLQDLQAAISNGADVNAQDRAGWTSLMLAAWYNQNPDIVRILLKAGADVNAQVNGTTALMFAAMLNSNPEVITALLNAGADVKAKNIWGQTALDYAQRNAKLKETDALQRLENASK